jgi:hypothetical protein
MNIKPGDIVRLKYDIEEEEWATDSEYGCGDQCGPCNQDIIHSNTLFKILDYAYYDDDGEVEYEDEIIVAPLIGSVSYLVNADNFKKDEKL